jgi:D-3-phosphoglycerate dehydrogenase
MGKIAIMGDRFMLSEIFEAAIVARCGAHELAIRKHDLPWPDVPMEHGYAQAGLDGLKEYLGEPDAVVEFVADSDIFVTHLAPLSASMMDRLPKLRLVAVSRGGPVNIDTKAARARNIRVVNAPGRNASAVMSSRSAPSCPQRATSRAATTRSRAGNWPATSAAPHHRRRAVGHDRRCHRLAPSARVVKLLKAFGCRILVCDYVQLAHDRNDAVLQVSLERLLADRMSSRCTRASAGDLA